MYLEVWDESDNPLTGREAVGDLTVTATEVGLELRPHRRLSGLVTTRGHAARLAYFGTLRSELPFYVAKVRQPAEFASGVWHLDFDQDPMMLLRYDDMADRDHSAAP